MASPHDMLAQTLDWREPTSPAARPLGVRLAPGQRKHSPRRPAPIPCCVASNERRPARRSHRNSSASTTGPGARVNAIEPSSSTSRPVRSSICCLTVTRQPSSSGSRTIPRSSWSVAIARHPAPERPPSPIRRRNRSPIDGICWRTSARPSSACSSGICRLSPKHSNPPKRFQERVTHLRMTSPWRLSIRCLRRRRRFHLERRPLRRSDVVGSSGSRRSRNSIVRGANPTDRPGSCDLAEDGASLPCSRGIPRMEATATTLENGRSSPLARRADR
jgi:hypothetical protein